MSLESIKNLVKVSKFCLVLLISTFVLPCALPAQQPYMWRLTDEDGLPSMTVYNLLQDSKGYMWFGTEAGLCRFDGREFKLFAAPTAKSRSATSLNEDKYGNVWFRNFAKQIFKIEKDKVHEIALPAHVTDALAYQFNLGDSLMLIDWTKVYVQSIPKKTWTKVAEIKSENDIFWDIHSDKDNGFWLFSQKGISKYKAGKLSIISETEHPQRFFVKDKKLYTFEDTRGRLLVWEQDQKQVLLPDAFTALSKQIIHSMYIDKSQNYWFCTSVGVFGFDRAGKALWAGKVLLPNIDVSRILQDREGVYWITTLKEGIFVLPQLDILLYNQLNSNLPTPVINCMETIGNKTLVLGLNNGVAYQFSAQKGVGLAYQTGQKQQIETMYYHEIYQKLYVGVSNLSVFKIESSVPIEQYSGGALKKIAFLNNQDAVLAGGSEARMARVHPEIAKEPMLDKSWLKYYPLYTKSLNVPIYSQIIVKRTRSVCVDKAKQEFWIASVDGLLLYQKNGVREIFDHKGKSIFGITITQSEDGTIWVGTIEQGLYGLKDYKVVTHLDQSKGLAGNFCRAISIEKNILWFSTGKGIQRYDTQKGDLQLFNKQDGLHTYDVLDLKIWRDTLWVATPKGLLSMHKDSLKTNQTPPLIYIQAFKIAEEPLKLNDTYTLPYHKNNLKIEFQGLAYRSRGEFKYKYRMLGLDSVWIFTNHANGLARYSSLPVGTYEFQVKAVNEDGIESEGMAIIQIVILPPWWQTWWAYMLWLGLLVGTLWLGFWWRLKRIQQKNKIEQDLRSSQLATLKVQMNPHFIFNALNSIQEFIWLNEKRLANQYLGKFADLMRLTLDMSNEKEVSLADEIKVLKLYLELENVRFENLAYQFELAPDLPTESIYIPSMLIQPYIENAIKHGLLHIEGERKLCIEMHQNNDFLICNIQDNGIGRKRSQEIQKVHPKRHKSFATSATQKRLDLLNYGRQNRILVNVLDLPNGTRVELQIPI